MTATSKDALFAEFAAVGKALGHPKRLELLDLLAQGPRSVEDLATSAGLGDEHLLGAPAQPARGRPGRLTAGRQAGLLPPRATTSPCGSTCARSHRSIARTPSPPAARTSVPTTRRRHRRACCAGSSRARWSSSTSAPSPSTTAGTCRERCTSPSTSSPTGWRSLPEDREVVAYCRGRYCVLAHDAVRLLTSRGLRARRATDGALEWRLAGPPHRDRGSLSSGAARPRPQAARGPFRNRLYHCAAEA